MSYHKPDTGNDMNNYFTSLADFTMLAPRLIEAKDEEHFEVWLEKLLLIDRRSLLIYIREHKNEIPEQHMKLVRRRFVEEI